MLTNDYDLFTIVTRATHACTSCVLALANFTMLSNEQVLQKCFSIRTYFKGGKKLYGPNITLPSIETRVYEIISYTNTCLYFADISKVIAIGYNLNKQPVV